MGVDVSVQTLLCLQQENNTYLGGKGQGFRHALPWTRGGPEDSLQQVPGLRSGQLHLLALAKSPLSGIQGQRREPGGGSDSPGA